MMRRFGSKCHVVQFEVCNPVKVPAKKPPPPPPPPPQLGCKVVQNRIDMSCPNVISFPKMMKVPVVLAKLALQICIDVDITLERPALEIKRVSKDVSLDECKLVPTSRKNHFKLFISGLIRKNIEYATAGPVNASGNVICGSILHTTAHIPFNSCTEVTFEGENFPDFLESSDTEARFLDKSGRGSKLDQKLFGHSVHYNEQPFCELVAFEINEFDFAKKNPSTPLPPIPNERTFITLQEQIVLDLLVKVLQNQQIPIPGKHDYEKECERRWDCNHDDDDLEESEKRWDYDYDHDDKEECGDHGHGEKCKKKCGHDHDEEECGDHGHGEKCKKKCGHDHDDEEKCGDHGHGKKCKKKRKKKCEHDHDDEEECGDHGHEKKCKKKRKKKCEHDHEQKWEWQCDHKHKIKYKKKCRKKRKKDS
jgi:hypothetical protein